ncbi:WD40/YVTN/BNR-like repeat-containing protein [Spiroplasma ixodetis]|uniref:WD40/YVTN/BNR-like repeat-containing protein n=1 Tax=Spiroplasma ixodetis TaxID=2141 RepID=UPI002575822A|nr:hypothetical protein [Spiroplasma ixodetis]WJG71311.1 hypothetical protein SIXOD_v1c27070 [Spiroplasma ixodetis Y32]
MKSLLSMLAVSTLVGTSGSSLQPMFAQKIVNTGFKSNQVNNKDISIKNQNNTNPFINKIPTIDNNSNISSNVISSNGTIYLGTYNKGLWKSTDGINFEQVTGLPNEVSAIATFDKTVYVGTQQSGLWKSTDGIKFIKTSFSGKYTSSITIDSSGNVYVDNLGALFKSKDGIKFEQVTGLPNEVSAISYLNNTIYVGMENKGLWKSTDGIKFEQVTGLPNDFVIQKIHITLNGTIYVGSQKSGLWKSTDGIKFEQVTGLLNDKIRSIESNSNLIIIGFNNGEIYQSNDGLSFNKIYQIDHYIVVNVTADGTIYVGTEKSGLLIINSLLKLNKPNYLGNLYNGIVYNSIQKIDIKENLVASAILDGKSQTVPKIGLDIPVGEHNLILTLKDKTLASVFGGDPNTGQVTYKLWVKTSIDKNKIDYQAKIDDTQLYTGLVSNTGNTNNADIIQTKIKNGTGTHNASINIDFKDILIDFDVNKSFYVQGTVDETTNNFTATGSKQKITKNLEIKIDGTYHLHLVDTVGNNYDSYLELGESNWKLKGTFDDSELDKLKSKLNVIVNLTDPSQKSKALGWLHQYENFVENKFNETIKTNGKGFDSEIKNQITSYTSFLKPLTYDIANEPKFTDGLDKNLLVKTITDKAKEILNKGLDALPKNLNVNTSNVVNKSTLDNYSAWIKNYQDFINKNKDKWINEIKKIASHGFATDEQENNIKAQVSQFLNNDNIKNYLKNVVWEDNKLLKSTSNDYQQYIELDKLKTDTINWVNQNLSAINTAYENAIKNAESGLHLHGYSISEILNGKQKPQIKSEIDNFADGQSYHDWLQSQANIKFHGWQLKIGLPIGLISLVIAVVAGCFIYRRTNPKYNGYWRGKKEAKLRKSNFKKNDIDKNNKSN